MRYGRPSSCAATVPNAAVTSRTTNSSPINRFIVKALLHSMMLYHADECKALGWLRARATSFPSQLPGKRQSLGHFAHVHDAPLALRKRRRQASLQRSARVGGCDDRRPVVQQTVDEVIELRGVGRAEALGEVRDDIVRHARARQHCDRRLAQIADLDRALRADYLTADVVAVDRGAADLNVAQPAT